MWQGLWRRRRRQMLLAVSVVTAAAVCLSVGRFERVQKTDGRRQFAAGYILVDAGHGLPDNGAVGADGTQESYINLAIARPLRDILLVLGCDVRMTREDDYGIYDGSISNIRDKKISDMRNRLALYNEAAVVVSIHQNMFTQSKYKGTQVFYSPHHPDGKPLAESIQQSARTLLQPDNEREIKKGGGSIYLLDNARVPAVLVECGFLSNPEECAKLRDAVYQRQMALAIVGGIIDARL